MGITAIPWLLQRCPWNSADLQLSTNITIQVEIIRGPLESDWLLAQDGAEPGQDNYIIQNLNSNRLALDANKTIPSLRNNTKVTAAAATAPASPANIKTEATGTATASALTVGTRATATLWAEAKGRPNEICQAIWWHRAVNCAAHLQARCSNNSCIPATMNGSLIGPTQVLLTVRT